MLNRLICSGYSGELPYPVHGQSEHVRELTKSHSLFAQLIHIGPPCLPFNQSLLFGSENVGDLCNMILGLLRGLPGGWSWSCTLSALVDILAKGIDQPKLDEAIICMGV